MTKLKDELVKVIAKELPVNYDGTNPGNYHILYKVAQAIIDYLHKEGWMRKREGIILNGHIENQTNFWVTVHLPNSGMIIDFMKKDLLALKGAELIR